MIFVYFTTVRVNLREPEFQGSADHPNDNGALRNQDIDHELLQRAQEKVDKYRGGYQANGLRHAFLPAIVATSGRIHGELLRLLYILADSRLPVEVFWRTRASLGLVCASRCPVHSGRRPNPLWVASGAPPCLSTIFRV